MTKKLRTIFCLALVFVMTLSATACSGKNTNGKEDGKQENEALKEDPLSKSYNISWISNNCGQIEEGNIAQKMIEEKLNIKLTTKKVDILQQQQVDLMLASGEMPDCGWIISKAPADLYDQGLTRSIPKKMIEKYAPSYTKLLNENPLGWKMFLDKGKTDEYITLTGYHANNADSLSYISTYRLDWLENVGIKPNGKLVQADSAGRVFIATEPFTQDQFVKILEAFTKSDPDKNGKDDTYGMAACVTKNIAWAPFMGMFGIQDGGSVLEDGKAKNYYVTKAYKDFLKFANDLYKKGYIDKEFPTLNNTKMWEKVESEKAGYSSTMVAYTNATLDVYAHRPPQAMLLKNPKAKVLITPPELGANNKGGTRAYTFTNFAYYFYVNKKVDDDKLAKILQMFDYINFDKDAKFFLRYGKEGEHFTWSGTPNDSTPKMKDGIKNGANTGFFSYNSNYIADAEMKKILEDSQNRKVADLARGEWAKYLWKPYKMDVLGQTKYDEYSKQLGNTINTLVDEFFCKAIVGEIDIDKEWDKYVKQVYDAGYAKMEEDLNKAPLYDELVKGK